MSTQTHQRQPTSLFLYFLLLYDNTLPPFPFCRLTPYIRSAKRKKLKPPQKTDGVKLRSERKKEHRNQKQEHPRPEEHIQAKYNNNRKGSRYKGNPYATTVYNLLTAYTQGKGQVIALILCYTCFRRCYGHTDRIPGMQRYLGLVTGLLAGGKCSRKMLLSGLYTS